MAQETPNIDDNTNGNADDAMRITGALRSHGGDTNRPLFVLLHGWGSNEYDLPDLMHYCAPGNEWASLRAPIPYGPGYTWFGEWAHEGVPEGASLERQAKAAADAIDRWVDANVPDGRKVVTMGFSQGGLLAAHLLRLDPARYVAALSFSGWLAPGAMPGDTALAESRPPVFYGHGSADTIFPQAELTAMRAFWEAHATLDEHIYPGMSHSICMDELRDAAAFCQRIGAAGPSF